MWAIYKRLWLINWSEQWQYRANLVMYLLYAIVSPIVFLSVWRAVAASQGAVNGLTVNDFTLYYLVLLVVTKITEEISIHILAWKIQDGTLANELLRPIHPILTGTLVYNLAFKVLTGMALAPILLGLALVFRPDFSSITLPNLLLAVPVLLLAFILNFLMGAVITCVAFWTTRVYSLAEFTYGFYLVLGGTFVPLELLPPFAQSLAKLLPFQLMFYFPIQLILGRVDPGELLTNLGLMAFWLVVMVIGFRVIWREGIKRFSAVGA